MVNQYRGNVNNDYLQWSMKVIVNWKNVTIPQNVIHIHGTKDKMFPSGYKKADYIIRGGEHFMVYNRADEINLILAKIIEADLFS